MVCLVPICRCIHGRFASFRKAFGLLRLLLYPLVFFSCQDTYPKAHGSASIYFSSQGWSAHVFKKNLRPGNVSTTLLHLAFLFSLLIAIFLKALNVVGLVSTCRCKGGRFMSFRGAFGLSSSLSLLLKAAGVIGRPSASVLLIVLLWKV